MIGAAPSLDVAAYAIAILHCGVSAARELGVSKILAAVGVVVAFALVVTLEQLAPPAAAVAVIFVICVLIFEIDRRHHIIPNLLVAALLLLAVVNPFSLPLAGQLLGGVLLGALFYGVRTAFALRGKPDALGLGDVKLAVAMGALLGAADAVPGVAIASLATALVLILRRRSGVRGAPLGIGLSAAIFTISLIQAGA